MTPEQTIDLGAYSMADWSITLHDRVITHFTIHEGTKLTIGRGEEADIVIDNPAISRLHAAMELQNGLQLLSDLGSTNGTTVNGQQISSAVPISEKDTIYIGKFRLMPGNIEAERVSSSYATAMDLDDQTVFVGSPSKKPEAAETHPGKEEFKLMAIQGDASPKELSLKGKSSIKIGKDPSCDMVITGFLVARAQCYIVSKKGKFFIAPQRSWVATKLNDVIIKKERLLRKGDTIEIRRVKIRFT